MPKIAEDYKRVMLNKYYKAGGHEFSLNDLTDTYTYHEDCGHRYKEKLFSHNHHLHKEDKMPSVCTVCRRMATSPNFVVEAMLKSVKNYGDTVDRKRYYAWLHKDYYPTLREWSKNVKIYRYVNSEDLSKKCAYQGNSSTAMCQVKKFL